MIEGRPAFDGISQQAIIASKVMGEVPEFATETSVPATVVDVTRKALAPSAEHRYSSSAELAQALNTAMTTEAIRADLDRRRRVGVLRIVGVQPPVATPMWRW